MKKGIIAVCVVVIAFTTVLVSRHDNKVAQKSTVTPTGTALAQIQNTTNTIVQSHKALTASLDSLTFTKLSDYQTLLADAQKPLIVTD